MNEGLLRVATSVPVGVGAGTLVLEGHLVMGVLLTVAYLFRAQRDNKSAVA